MFCKNCGKQLPDNLYYCPGCGAKSNVKSEKSGLPGKRPEQAASRNGGKNFFLILACVAVMIGGVWWIKSYVPKNSRNDPEVIGVESTNSGIMETESDSQPEVIKQEPLSVIGTWKCETGEVTFTEKGHMMLGKDGISLGGGWLKYEIVDDSTLYLSGGDMPVGINMKYELDGSYLSLELNGETIIFFKE